MSPESKSKAFLECGPSACLWQKYFIDLKFTGNPASYGTCLVPFVCVSKSVQQDESIYNFSSHNISDNLA